MTDDRLTWIISWSTNSQVLLRSYQKITLFNSNCSVFFNSVKISPPSYPEKYDHYPLKWPRKFHIRPPKRWNPIFSSYITQPNLRLWFEAYDSVNGVTGHNACTVLSVSLTDNDPIARACARASYLWTCELYNNEIWYYAVWRDHRWDRRNNAPSQRRSQ